MGLDDSMRRVREQQRVQADRLTQVVTQEAQTLADLQQRVADIVAEALEWLRANPRPQSALAHAKLFGDRSDMRIVLEDRGWYLRSTGNASYFLTEGGTLYAVSVHVRNAMDHGNIIRGFAHQDVQNWHYASCIPEEVAKTASAHRLQELVASKLLHHGDEYAAQVWELQLGLRRVDTEWRSDDAHACIYPRDPDGTPFPAQPGWQSLSDAISVGLLSLGSEPIDATSPVT